MQMDPSTRIWHPNNLLPECMWRRHEDKEIIVKHSNATRHLRTFAPIVTAHLFAHVTHTSFIVDHARKHDAKGAKNFHKNGT